MKSKLIVAAIAITILAVSCQKDPVRNTVDQRLLGKWFYTLDTLKYNQNGGTYNIISTATYNRVEFLQFNADGTGTDFYNSVATNFTYSVTNNLITFNYPASSIPTAIGLVYILPYTKKANIRYATANNLALLFNEYIVNTGFTENDYEAKYFMK